MKSKKLLATSLMLIMSAGFSANSHAIICSYTGYVTWAENDANFSSTNFDVRTSPIADSHISASVGTGNATLTYETALVQTVWNAFLNGTKIDVRLDFSGTTCPNINTVNGSNAGELTATQAADI